MKAFSLEKSQAQHHLTLKQARTAKGIYESTMTLKKAKSLIH
jgi:hypothetical protein